ncbi:MAG: efflux RND transporter periplasmic adaptor subunit [Gammaproteobacteria bacterium]|nr:efflux RND transporter periplasmic adaptor subunit [Gammaproteobacteria bacterium]
MHVRIWREGVGTGAGVLLGWLLWGVVQGAAPLTQVIVSPVRTVQFEDRIDALGTLRASESVSLTASVTETISALYFDDGDRVAAGKVLAEMTSAEEHAQLNEVRALVEEADLQYRRVQSLATQGTAAQALRDERRREYDTARARLNGIESRLSDRLIKAPFDGVVGLRNISVGALVEPGDLITTLDNDVSMKLDLTVPSLFLSSLKPGLAVSAATSAYGARTFTGAVHSIDSRVDPVTRSLLVRVLLPNPERLLKPGMLMQVSLHKDPRQTLVISEAALLPAGQEQFVLVAVPDTTQHKAEKRRIRIGSRRPGEVEVVQGLHEGELVITHGALRVRPGQSVMLRAVDQGGQSLSELLEHPKQAGAPGRSE